MYTPFFNFEHRISFLLFLTTIFLPRADMLPSCNPWFMFSSFILVTSISHQRKKKRISLMEIRNEFAFVLLMAKKRVISLHIDSFLFLYPLPETHANFTFLKINVPIINPIHIRQILKLCMVFLEQIIIKKKFACIAPFPALWTISKCLKNDRR